MPIHQAQFLTDLGVVSLSGCHIIEQAFKIMPDNFRVLSPISESTLPSPERELSQTHPVKQTSQPQSIWLRFGESTPG